MATANAVKRSVSAKKGSSSKSSASKSAVRKVASKVGAKSVSAHKSSTTTAKNAVATKRVASTKKPSRPATATKGGISSLGKNGAVPFSFLKGVCKSGIYAIKDGSITQIGEFCKAK